MSDSSRSPREVIAEVMAPAVHNWNSPHYLDSADAVLEALRSNGFVVVPREPTEAMVDAADCIGYHVTCGRRFTRSELRREWSEMLSVWECLSTNPDREGE